MKQTIQFKDMPDSSGFQIPFKLKDKFLIEWLQEVSSFRPEHACLNMFKLMRALNGCLLSSVKRAEFLEHIKEYLNASIKQLPNSCWDASFPLSAGEQRYAEIIGWCHLAMAEGFFIAASDAGKKADRARLLATALQAMREAQLHIAATYSTVCRGFWKLTYQVFREAENKKIQHLEIKNSNLPSINTLFSQLLIFHVCDSYQYRTRDMLTLFKFLGNCCNNLDIEHHIDSFDGMFMLDLETDEPAVNLKRLSEIAVASARYFSPVLIAEEIEYIIENENPWTGSLKAINDSLFERVIKTLKLEQKRRHQRKDANIDLLGVIGLEDILGFLHKVSKNKIVIEKEDREETGGENAGSRLDLLDEANKSHDFIKGAPENFNFRPKPSSNKQEIWHEVKNRFDPARRKVSLKKMTIVDKSATGYSVNWSKANVRAKIGDIFGIIPEDKNRLEIAIIRRLAQHSDDFYHFGVEILGFKSEIIYLRPSSTSVENGVWGVLLPGSKEHQRPLSVIYPNCGFACGENYYIHRSEKISLCSFAKIINSTSSFCHVEIAAAVVSELG